MLNHERVSQDERRHQPVFKPEQHRNDQWLAEAVAVLAGVRLFVGLVYKIFPFYTGLIVSPSQTAVARAMRQVLL